MPKPDIKQAAYDALVVEILTLTLAPGAPLDETRLADRFGLSRTPMREVLHRLSGAGFVEQVAHLGTKVASMDMAILRTFFQTAPLVYASVARLAAENHKGAQLAELKTIQRAFRTAVEQDHPGEAATCNHRFHAHIGTMAANPYLVAALERMLIDHTRLSQTFYRPASTQQAELVAQAAGQHDQMIQAFEARDPETAVDLSLQHWDLSRGSLERFVSPDPLPITVPSIRSA